MELNDIEDYNAYGYNSQEDPKCKPLQIIHN
jgi:hypothetical protein